MTSASLVQHEKQVVLEQSLDIARLRVNHEMWKRAASCHLLMENIEEDLRTRADPSAVNIIDSAGEDG